MLLAAGHVAGDLVAPFEQAREQREHFVAPVARLRGSLGVTAHLQVLVDGQRRKHAPAFGYLHNPTPHQFIRCKPMHLLISETDDAILDHAFFGVENAGHRLQKRRFPGAIGTQQRDDATLRDGDTDIADGFDGVVVDDANIAKFEQAWTLSRHHIVSSHVRLHRDRHCLRPCGFKHCRRAERAVVG